jgi:molybdopterin molybdotransferase
MASADPRRHGDVRMRGFVQRARVTDVWQWLAAHVQPLPPENVPVTQAASRVLADAVISPIDVPSFARAMMDGYALQAGDTAGASAYQPVSLAVIDQALPGRPARQAVAAGQAIRIMTGAPLPAGADAVLPAEHVRAESASLWALQEITPGKHVAQPGEDIAAGTVVLHPGRRLRPQDVGVLASIGVATVPVTKRPRVRLVITGNELLPAGSRPGGAQIVDSNGPMLAALVDRDGGEARHPGIVPDDPALLRAAMTDAEADVILVSGGSSVGQEDYAPHILAAEGELLFHGVAMRPSSPAGLGRLGQRLVFLLPGNPVSCLCAYDFFAGRAIRLLGGRPWEWPYRVCRRKLRRKLVSTVGRVDYARVRLVEDEIEPLAISGAAVLSSTTRADGFVVVPEDSEGYAEQTEVDLFLYDL